MVESFRVRAILELFPYLRLFPTFCLFGGALIPLPEILLSFLAALVCCGFFRLLCGLVKFWGFFSYLPLSCYL